MRERLSPDILDADLDLSYLSADSDVYDFKEIIRESVLEARCSRNKLRK